ncbi:SDR family oxidoreductase [Undibacterium sp. TJN19]|uniref:SDR family oxidoreductase n=1 Tax=Undibacterium sp. TJN19 TaxID=3413055 RepID=UPI003BF045F6
MKILICGANGFLGRHISLALQQARHEVCHGVRQRSMGADCNKFSELEINYAQDTDPAVWIARLQKLGQIDVIINAIGILNESETQRFTDIHRDAPIALFQAASYCGVKAVVQLSALGGKQDGNVDVVTSAYMKTKRAADAHLMQTGLTYLILRPSLVVGIDGISSSLFRCLASLPALGLPGHGEQQLQPVHIDDICTAIVIWLANTARNKMVLHAVGPQAMTYRAMLENYRLAMGMSPQLLFGIPMPLMRTIAKMAMHLPQKILTPDSLSMLELGNTADAGPFEAHLQKPPTSAKHWFDGIPADMLASAAIAKWCLPLFRLTLAILWLVTAALSFGIYPVESSLQLLAPLGLNGMPAFMVLMSASMLDLGLGVATLLWPGRILWLAQIILIISYSLIIAIFSPEFYLHPFGPVLKNLPILALLLYLYAHASGQKMTTQRVSK